MPSELQAALPWILCSLAGIFFGWLITLLALSGRRVRLEEQIKSDARRMTEMEARHAAAISESAELERNCQAFRTQLAEVKTRLEDEVKSAAEKQALLEGAEQRLSNTFKALSADALRSSS
jgi:DNA recombination protein RmuC